MLIVDIIIRESRPADMEGVLEAYRDSNDSLRESRGGSHPDHAIDELISTPDAILKKRFFERSIVYVAEDRSSGEIVGFSVLSDRWSDRLIGSTHLKALYVKGRCQRGRAGISVGRLLAQRRLDAARARGYRKAYSLSVPESVGFQERLGARFFPEHDTPSFWGGRLRYFEYELRKSPLNRFIFEPYLYKIRNSIRGFLRKG